MSTKKRNNKTKAPLKRKGVTDERVPKLMGIFCIFLSLYLLVAFVSYLFTWQADQDRVLRFSWRLFTQSDLSMANWLGRLGAIVSNMFFYWGFGVPSFLFVGLLCLWGQVLIKRSSKKRFYQVFKYTLIIILVLSVLLEFIFSGSTFSWGGAFGESINAWLHKFVGTAGMILLFLFSIAGLATWMFNPNFSDMTMGSAWREIKLYFQELYSGQLNRRKTTPLPSMAATGLKPKGKTIPKPSTAKPTVPPTATEPIDRGSQLSFDLVKKERQKPEVLSKDSQLEIQAPAKTVIPPTGIAAAAAGAAALNVAKKGIPQPTLSVEKENKTDLDPFDPTLELSSFENPVTSLLQDYSDNNVEIDRAELESNKDLIIETLLNYKIEITKIRATIGPTVTLYEIVPAPGVRISKIKNLEDDIALSLSALGIRIIAPIPGRGTIGIEVPNKNMQTVGLKEILISEKFKRAKMDLPIALGKTISNEVFVADLAKMPHLLVAGATGQGKSVGINTILMSLLYKKHPSQVKLVLVDPKKVELFPYAKLENHFLAYLPNQDEPITTETNKVVHTLNSLTIEMDDRYNLLKKAHARNIKEYNAKFVKRTLNPEKGHKFLPFIVLVIDEFADLIMTAGKEVELPIGRLAQLARAVGIHLIIATQRPSVNIITGVIKANFPARLAFKVTSKIDSRTILDGSGAEQLVGRGDMLLTAGGDTIRLQCAFVDTPEVESVIDFIAAQQGYPVPHFLPEFVGDDEEHAIAGQLKLSELDDLFEDAARLVVGNQHGSTSMIQRRLKLGYNRAGRIMDQMEALGIVGASVGSKPREVLFYGEVELEAFLKNLKEKK